MKNNILNEIIYNKEKWLKYRKYKQPLHVIKKNITCSCRNFYDVLKIHNPFFILEAKKSAPSSGVININFNIRKICKIYKRHASVVSILTDEKYFHGKFEFIQEASKIITQPILCKDFFIDPYQIYLARLYQADAILLMLSILNDNQYKILSDLAHSMKMGVITEINNIYELNRAIKLNAQVIGINNRNLHDLSIDIKKTYHLAPLVPKNKIIISESGINNNIQIKKLKKIVHGFLIGSALMKAKDINVKMNSIIFGNNKVCGLTRQIDAKRIKQLGAVYGGLIFIKNSLRNISIDYAEKIVKFCPLRYIGVFKNEKIQNIIYIIKKLPLYAIQLHGDEDQEYINTIKKKISHNVKIWKAIDIVNNINKLNMKFVDYYLFDNSEGGSGKCFDWSILHKYNLKNVFLSGGLSVNNVRQAIQLNCFGLDFNSQLEKIPGVKDYKLMTLLFNKLKIS